MERELYPPPTEEEVSAAIYKCTERHLTERSVASDSPQSSRQYPDSGLVALCCRAGRTSLILRRLDRLQQLPPVSLAWWRERRRRSSSWYARYGGCSWIRPAGESSALLAFSKMLTINEFANAFVLLFQFLSYIIPIGGGWVADTKLGKFKTILIGVFICGVAHIIMICGAIPSLLQAGRGAAPFIISLLLLAIGAGIFKPSIAPMIMDQYRHQKSYVRVLPRTGERVVVDPESTIQRIMLIFYAIINVGAFFAIATTYCEKYVGYWLAFLLPGIVYFALPFLLWYLNDKLVKYPPDGTVLVKAFKIFVLALIKSRGKLWNITFLDTAKPSGLATKNITTFRGKPIDWADKHVEDVKRTVTACLIFLYLP